MKKNKQIDWATFYHAAEYMQSCKRKWPTSCSAIYYGARKTSLFVERYYTDATNHLEQFANWFKPRGGGAFFFEEGLETSEQLKIEKEHRTIALLFMCFIQQDLDARNKKLGAKA